MTNDVFKWAVMGPGGIASKFAKALSGVPGAMLYAVGSRDLKRAQEFAAQYGAEKAYGSYEELAQDPDVDAFYISTPHIQHCENAIMCLERGKPVLCEKPMSINAGFERRMIETARRNNVFLMEAMWSRFLPAAKKARELIAQGTIGEPRMVSADFSFSAPPDPAVRHFNHALAGGALLDVGIYVLSFASMIFGAHPVKSAAYATIGRTDVDENTAIILQYPGGQISSLTCSLRAVGPSIAHIMGTEGIIDLPQFWTAETLRLTRGDKTEEFSLPFIVNGFEYEIMEVMRCIRRGLLESPAMKLEESLANMETMDEMRRGWGLEYPTERE